MAGKVFLFMNTLLFVKILLVFGCWVALQRAFTATTQFSSSFPTLEKPSNGGKMWALLVAGSNEWYNYRHQADICHAYQILHSNGIPDENIVVMMYDDIASYSGNPMPGKIINKPNGKDVYKGVVKDYVGDDVNKKNFLNILQGNKAAMKNIGSGKVIESGPNDHVFINFVDHGSTGLLCFPNEYMYANELMKALKSMSHKKKFNKLLLYIEACEAGSMFENLLPKNIKILASTASNSAESSYGCYCQTSTFDTCLGDLYSVTWMEHLDAITPDQEKKETILSEYKYVRKNVNESHVMLYGDKKHINSDKVHTFLGISNSEKTPELSELKPQLDTVPSRDIGIHSLKMRIQSSKTKMEKKELTKKLEEIEKMRTMVDDTMSKIAQEISTQEVFDKRYPVTSHAMLCYKDLIEQFSEKCINTLKNTYMLRYFYVFLNMCSMESINKEDVISAFNTVCTETQRTASGII